MTITLENQMKKVIRGVELLFGKRSCYLARYDMVIDKEALSQAQPDETYLWVIREMGTNLLLICSENKENLDYVTKDQNNIAFFKIHGEILERITRFKAELIARSL